MDEYIEGRHIAKAVIRQKVLAAPPLPATKEYRYIEPVQPVLSDWDEEKGKRARARSLASRRKKATPKVYVHKWWTPEEVEEIGKMRAAGMKWKDIGEKFDVSAGTVRKAWIHNKEEQ